MRNPAAADKAGNQHRSQRVAFAVWLLLAFFSLWTSGIIFGWPSFVLLLNYDGVHTELCPGGSLDCEERQMQISLMFTAGYCSNLCGRIGWGLLLDSKGPRFTAVSCAVTIFVGAILLGASLAGRLDGFIPGFALVGLGGAGIHLSNFHTSNLFPVKRKTVITSFSGAFNASGLIPMVFLGMYVSGMTSSAIFIAYACLAFCIGIGYFIVQPSSSFKIGDGVAVQGLRVITVPASDSEGPSPAAQKMRIRDALLHWKMLGLTFFFCAEFLHSQYYQGQAEEVLNRLGDRDYGNAYFLAFNAIGSSAVLLTYPIGLFLDKVSFDTAFFVSLFLALTLSAVSLVDNLPLQLVTFVCWTTSRMIMFAAYFAFIPSVVGFARFGITSGCMSVICALGGLLNIPIAKFTREENSFKPVMMGFIVLLLLAGLFPLSLRRARHLSSTKQAEASNPSVPPASA